MSPIGGIDLIDAIDTIGLVDDIDMIDSFITIIFDTKKPGRRPGLGWLMPLRHQRRVIG